MRIANVVPLAFFGTLVAATIDIKIIAESCAGTYFQQAMQAPENPCKPADNYECVCGAGFGFVSNFLVQALAQNPGSCQGNQLLDLQDKAKQACNLQGNVQGGSQGGVQGNVEGGAGAPAGVTTPPTTPVTTPPVTPPITPNVTIPTGIIPPGGNNTPPVGTPTSPSVFTGAAATAAIGQMVGAAGAVAAAMAFGM
ncbi:uncharacterized protein J3D65DRAFT_214777 [Phyllosticta citribraziliensis]|uniref:Extracellular membrane protein CFEM domain-containing protein n=1 Tax=Phyllosticta citribraziliensis TaxID=989973 RepID=A0ABR1M496_9PEZI